MGETKRSNVAAGYFPFWLFCLDCVYHVRMCWCAVHNWRCVAAVCVLAIRAFCEITMTLTYHCCACHMLVGTALARCAAAAAAMKTPSARGAIVNSRCPLGSPGRVGWPEMRYRLGCGWRLTVGVLCTFAPKTLMLKLKFLHLLGILAYYFCLSFVFCMNYGVFVGQTGFCVKTRYMKLIRNHPLWLFVLLWLAYVRIYSSLHTAISVLEIFSFAV